MKRNQNVVLDFTQTNSQQELAVMSASMAKKLLKMLVNELVHTGPRKIIADHIAKLEEVIAGDTEGILPRYTDACRDFVQERDLIYNVTEGNWDAYKVAAEEVPMP